MYRRFMETVKMLICPSWSKEPGLGPGMFACAGSNPAVNKLQILLIIKFFINIIITIPL